MDRRIDRKVEDIFKEEKAKTPSRYDEPTMILVRGGSKPIDLTKEALDYALELLKSGDLETEAEALHAAAGEYAHKGWFTPTPDSWREAIALSMNGPEVTDMPEEPAPTIDEVVKSILRHTAEHDKVKKAEYSFDKEARVRYWSMSENPEQAEEDFQHAIMQAEKLLGLKIDVDNYRVGDP